MKLITLFASNDANSAYQDVDGTTLYVEFSADTSEVEVYTVSQNNPSENHADLDSINMVQDYFTQLGYTPNPDAWEEA